MNAIQGAVNPSTPGGGRLRIFTGKQADFQEGEAVISVRGLTFGIVDAVETDLNTCRVYRDGSCPRALRRCPGVAR